MSEEPIEHNRKITDNGNAKNLSGIGELPKGKEFVRIIVFAAEPLADACHPEYVNIHPFPFKLARITSRCS